MLLVAYLIFNTKNGHEYVDKICAINDSIFEALENLSCTIFELHKFKEYIYGSDFFF